MITFSPKVYTASLFPNNSNLQVLDSHHSHTYITKSRQTKHVALLACDAAPVCLKIEASGSIRSNISLRLSGHLLEEDYRSEFGCKCLGAELHSDFCSLL